MNGRDFERNHQLTKLATPLRAMIVAMALALLAAPAAVGAQGLPSADELDASEPDDEVVETEPDEDPAEPEDAPAEGDEAEGDEADQKSADEGDSEAAEDEDASDQADGDETSDGELGGDEADDAAAADERLVDTGVNIEGARGFQHMASAVPGKANTYHVAFLGSFTSGEGVVRYQDQNEYFTGNLLFQATIMEHFTANLGVGASNNVNTFGRPQAMLAQGDLHLGVRGHLNPQPGIYVAGDLTAFVPTGFASAGLDAGSTSVRPRLLTTAEFGEYLPRVDGAKVPLTGHFNFGYRFDNTSGMVPDDTRLTRVERFAHDISGYDYLQFGLGFEYGLPYVSPFMAWNLDVPVNPDDAVCPETSTLDCVSDRGFAGYPNVLSLGLRAEPIDNLGLTAGVDIGLTSEDVEGIPVTAPWQMILGASWAIDPEPKIEYVEKVVEKEIEKMPPQAFVLGTVTDEETGETISGATVRYLGSVEKTPQSTSDDGSFHSYGFEPGSELSFEISHPRYKPAEASQKLDEEGEAELAVSLEPLPRKGTVGGVVIDQEGEPIANATLELTGPETEKVTADADGRFQLEVTAGDYTVAAHADDYLTGGRDAEVATNRELQLEITLQPKPEEKLVEVEEDRIRINEKVFFETGKAKILPRSFNVLDQVGSVLLETPRIKGISIDGHTDDVGADDYNMELSQDRADSVRKYLIEKGISPDRLEARGLGETEPLVPNTSKRNQSLNRRVEFRITDQGLDETEKSDESRD
ncbi:MAG: carboxypeptidase regulatory-like domain-containing protein [Persicimonas sp.]